MRREIGVPFQERETRDWESIEAKGMGGQGRGAVWFIGLKSV
jgi:hypothetical protein